MKKITFIAWVHFQQRSEFLAQQLGGTMHFIHHGQRGKLLQLPIRYLLQTLHTWRVLRRECSDVVFVQNPPIFCVIVAFFYARTNGARCVIDSYTGAFVSPWRWFVDLHRVLSRKALTTILHKKSHEEMVKRFRCCYSVLAYTPDDHSFRGLSSKIGSIVYSPFNNISIVRFSGNLLAGSWGTCEAYGEGFCNLVYISDLVAGILSSVGNERAFGEAFNMNGPESITWNDYFQKLNTALGRPRAKAIHPIKAKLRTTALEFVRPPAKFVLANFESPLKRVAHRSKLARIIMESFEKKIKTTPRPHELSLYNRKAIYVDSKARSLFGYKPKADLNRGLALSVCWLKHLGLDQFSTTGGRGI